MIRYYYNALSPTLPTLWSLLFNLFDLLFLKFNHSPETHGPLKEAPAFIFLRLSHAPSNHLKRPYILVAKAIKASTHLNNHSNHGTKALHLKGFSIYHLSSEPLHWIFYPMAECGTTCPKLLLLLLVFFIPFQLSFFHGKASEFQLEDEAWLDENDDEVSMAQGGHDSLSSSCDFSDGKWVYDLSYPLYDTNCPYLSTPVTCQKNGRPDSDYEKWRWKPHGCSIPRYDGTGTISSIGYSREWRKRRT